MEKELIRKIVREELEKALCLIKEEVPFQPKTKTPEVSSKEDIIYNFDKGRAFGFNELQDKIKNLQHYNLTDYLPMNENLEKWIFEHATPYEKILIIEIKHKIVLGKSLWIMIFSSLEKGEPHPVIENASGSILGYDNFISEVNSKFSDLIDPRRN